MFRRSLSGRPDVRFGSRWRSPFVWVPRVSTTRLRPETKVNVCVWRVRLYFHRRSEYLYVRLILTGVSVSVTYVGRQHRSRVVQRCAAIRRLYRETASPRELRREVGAEGFPASVNRVTEWCNEARKQTICWPRGGSLSCARDNLPDCPRALTVCYLLHHRLRQPLRHRLRLRVNAGRARLTATDSGGLWIFRAPSMESRWSYPRENQLDRRLWAIASHENLLLLTCSFTMEELWGASRGPEAGRSGTVI